MSLKGFLSVALLLMLGGCSSFSEPPQGPRAKAYAAVSTQSADFAPKAGQRVAWHPKGILWSMSHPVAHGEQLSQHLMAQLEAELTLRGLAVVTDAQQADYILGVAILDHQSEISEQVAGFFQISPGMMQPPAGQNASVMLAMVENQPWLFNSGRKILRQNLLWRSGLETQVLQQTNLGERKRRVEEMTQVLLKNFPKVVATPKTNQ